MHKYMAYKVLFIDEEKEQQDDFKDYMDAASELQVECVFPESELEDMIQRIDEIAPNAIVCDFLLNEIKVDIKHTVKYTGSDLVNEYQRQRPAFPCFVLTSHDDEAVVKSDDVNVVYVKDLLHNGEPEAKAKFYAKIEEQINKYRKSIDEAQKELSALLEKKRAEGLNSVETDRMIELDNFIERSLHAESVVPSEYKLPESMNKLSALIDKVDLLISQNK